MKAYGGVLTSALFGGEWSTSRRCRFTPGERAPGTHWIGGWVDPRASLDDLEKRKSHIIMKSVFYSSVVLGYACQLIVTNLVTEVLNLNFTN
jgi:hypothetical protein